MLCLPRPSSVPLLARVLLAIKNETELKWSSQSEMGTLLDSGHLSKGIIASTSEEKIIGVLGSPEIEINLCTVSSSTEEAVGYVVPWGEH